MSKNIYIYTNTRDTWPRISVTRLMLKYLSCAMPKPYSDDIRWRIVWQRLFYNRSSVRVAADLFVCRRTVDRIFTLFINTGNVKSPHKFGRPVGTTTLYQHEELVICEMVIRRPYIYLKEIASELQNGTGRQLSIPSMCAAVHRLGFTRKKVRFCIITRCIWFGFTLVGDGLIFGPNINDFL